VHVVSGKPTTCTAAGDGPSSHGVSVCVNVSIYMGAPIGYYIEPTLPIETASN